MASRISSWRTMRPTRTTRDLWHEAGRAARDGRKRFVAALGLVFGVPVAVAVAALGRLVFGAVDASAIYRPLRYVLAPIGERYWADDDFGLLLLVGAHAVAQALLWAWWGGRLARMAVVDLALGRPDDVREANVFVRRRWGTFALARIGPWVGVLAPLVGALLLALSGRFGGALGGVGFAAAIALGGVLALAAAVGIAALCAGGFLVGPAIAAEGGDAFDAVTRAYTYVARDLPRLCAQRLLFGLGVLLGSGWRAVRAIVACALGAAALAHAAPVRWDRALAIWEAGGAPHDGARLGIGWSDHLAAIALTAALGGIVLHWLSDLLARIACARAAVYLLTRERLEGVPLDALRAPPRLETGAGSAERARPVGDADE